MLRALLVRSSEDEHVLLLTVNHIAFDGWSINIICRELAALYEAFLKGEPSPLPELPIQYADYASWQRQWLSAEVLEGQMRYWKRQLGGTLPTLRLPTDRPRSTPQTYQGGYHTFVLPSSLIEPLKELSRRENVTLYMTMLAAFKTLLHRYTNQDDIIVGTAIAGRNRKEIEDLIGFFVNTLLLRTDMSGEPSFRALLKRVREVTLGAYGHQDLPFERLVEELRPERNLRQPPLLQVTFGLWNAPQEPLELSGLTVRSKLLDTDSLKLDLTLWLFETDEGLGGKWKYNAALFDESTIVRMHGHFETLLHSIGNEPDAWLSKLELVAEFERTQQLISKQKKREANLDKLKSIRRKAVSLSDDAL
jgi:hypothetical protein